MTCLVAQLCLTLCDPMDYSLPGSSMGFSWQEYCWVAISSSRGSSQPRDWTGVTCISCIAVDSLPLSHWGSPLFPWQTLVIDRWKVLWIERKPGKDGAIWSPKGGWFMKESLGVSDFCIFHYVFWELNRKNVIFGSQGSLVIWVSEISMEQWGSASREDGWIVIINRCIIQDCGFQGRYNP